MNENFDHMHISTYIALPCSTDSFNSIEMTKMAGLIKLSGFMLVIAMVMLKIQGLSDVEQIETLARRWEENYMIGNYSGVISLYTEDARIFIINATEIRGAGGEYI